MPDVGIELGAARMPSGHASDRTTAPGNGHMVAIQTDVLAMVSCIQLHIYLLFIILTQRTCIANGTESCFILQQITGQNSMTLTAAVL